MALEAWSYLKVRYVDKVIKCVWCSGCVIVMLSACALKPLRGYADPWMCGYMVMWIYWLYGYVCVVMYLCAFMVV